MPGNVLVCMIAQSATERPRTRSNRVIMASLEARKQISVVTHGSMAVWVSVTLSIMEESNRGTLDKGPGGRDPIYIECR